jgi:hypothetical protein
LNKIYIFGHSKLKGKPTFDPFRFLQQPVYFNQENGKWSQEAKEKPIVNHLQVSRFGQRFINALIHCVHDKHDCQGQAGVNFTNILQAAFIKVQTSAIVIFSGHNLPNFGEFLNKSCRKYIYLFAHELGKVAPERDRDRHGIL